MTTDQDRLIDTREAAAILGLKETTLAMWRWGHRGPTYRRIGRTVRYRLADVLAHRDRDVVRPVGDDTGGAR